MLVCRRLHVPILIYIGHVCLVCYICSSRVWLQRESAHHTQIRRYAHRSSYIRPTPSGTPPHPPQVRRAFAPIVVLKHPAPCRSTKPRRGLRSRGRPHRPERPLRFPVVQPRDSQTGLLLLTRLPVHELRTQPSESRSCPESGRPVTPSTCTGWCARLGR